MHSPTPPRGARRALPAGLAAIFGLALVAGVLAFATPRRGGDLPPIVFVSRRPVADDPRAIPGFGPLHRAAVTGGRLLIRDRDGGIRSLLADSALFDVSDPAISFDASTVLFAGTPHPDSAWRIYRVSLDGTELHPILTGGAALSFRGDDLDPCWLTDSVLCFASTRESDRSQLADVRTTNLWTVRLDGRGLTRLTADRNGAEEPTVDPRTGRVLYARWWFNAYRPSTIDPSGITTDPALAMPGDSVNQWQVVELAPDGGSFRLAAAGGFPSRRGSMAYQPAVVNGAIVAVSATHLGLWPRPGPTTLSLFSSDLAEVRRLAGAAISEGEVGDPYHDARGLAAPSAASPAALPDGRVVFALDPGARGDFGLWCVRTDGSGLEPLVDLPGTLELDPAPVFRRAVPPATVAASAPGSGTFVFFCRNLFATGPLDSGHPDPPPLADGLRLRFFEALPRPGRASGDTALLVREAMVAADGSVRAEGLPAHTPMFEQLVDHAGRPVMTAHGAAHVRGLNFGAPGATLRCVGCHAGHSVLAAGDEIDAAAVRVFDAAGAAEVTASSTRSGTAGPRAAVDLRTRGPLAEVAWVASDADTGWLRLRWKVPLRLEQVRLHGPALDRRAGTDLVIRRSELRAFRGGVEIARHAFPAPTGRAPITLDCGGERVDAIEVRIVECEGRVEGRRVLALAEVETLARLAEPIAARGTPGLPGVR